MPSSRRSKATRPTPGVPSTPLRTRALRSRRSSFSTTLATRAAPTCGRTMTTPRWVRFAVVVEHCRAHLVEGMRALEARGEPRICHHLPLARPAHSRTRTAHARAHAHARTHAHIAQGQLRQRVSGWFGRHGLQGSRSLRLHLRLLHLPRADGSANGCAVACPLRTIGCAVGRAIGRTDHDPYPNRFAGGSGGSCGDHPGLVTTSTVLVKVSTAPFITPSAPPFSLLMESRVAPPPHAQPERTTPALRTHQDAKTVTKTATHTRDLARARMHARTPPRARARARTHTNAQFPRARTCTHYNLAPFTGSSLNC